MVNDDRGGSQSPEIERENPFRDVMMKFAGMEQRAKERKDKEEEEKKKRINKATETIVTRVDSKATQTFRSVLNTQLSCPAKSRSSRINNTERELSYTAKPRPYLAGQINRSLSMGQSLHNMADATLQQQQQQLQQQIEKKNDDYLMTQSFCGALPTAFSSVNITEQQQPQQQRQQQHHHHPKRSSSSHARTPSIHKMPSSELSSLQSSYYQHQRPLIWHASPYSSSPSLHIQQQQQQQQQQQHLRQVNSGYFSYSPAGYQGTTLRHAPQQNRRPLSVYNRPTTLHIEGQSSLV